LDWSKAKNILIAMFLIINIFLTYQLISISRNQYKYINKEELQSVIDYLGKKNVQVEAEIPDRVWIAPSLRVKYQTFDSKALGDIIFNNGDYKVSGTAEAFTLAKDNISIQVKEKMHLTYNNPNIEIKQNEVDEDKCLNIAYSFVSKLKLNNNHRYVKLKELKQGYIRLVLGQQYSNIPVESSLIEIIATEEGVSNAKVSWFESIKPDKKHNITTPVVALLKANERWAEAGTAVEVRQIRQGYYFNTEIAGDSKELILEGTVSPMWVVLSDRDEIYVNAYNENIEKVR